MTDALTARQTKILKSVVDEYIETAGPVGSEQLEKKYELGVSPATIRNEMAILTKLGFLVQPHTSAGRIPSPKAIKFYINQLMEEERMSLADEVKAKEEVWDARSDIDKLLDETVHCMARYTKNLAIAVTNDGKIWHSGYANVFQNPEFADLKVCTSLFTLLEEVRRVQELFFEKLEGKTNVEVIFGEDLDWPELAPIGIVAVQLKIKDKNAALAVVGPARLSYPTIIPTLRYFGNLIQEITI